MQIELTTADSVVSGTIQNGHLILTRQSGATVDTGSLAAVGVPDASSTVKGLIMLAGDLTGAATAPALTTTGVAAASYGSASTVPQFTVDAKGRISTAQSVNIALPESAITNLVTDLGAKAPTISPAFTGTPTAPTATAGTNTTQLATCAFVTTQLSGLATLASPTFTGVVVAPTPATGDNSTTVATTGYVQAQGYATLASPALSGTPTVPTAPSATSSTQAASTAFVKNQGYAPLASPALTGAPTAPTANAGTNNTQIATTGFVASAVSGLSSGGGSGLTNPMTAAGDLIVGGTAGSPTRLPSNTTSTKNFLTETSGSAAWGTIANADVSGSAPLDSPALTGTPTAPTQANGDSDTSIATTAFVQNAISGLSAGGGTSGDAATPYGVVWLDSYAGSTDDAKLAAALSATAADTYPRTIRLAARSHAFATQVTAFTGMRIEGPAGYANPERGTSKAPMNITLSMAGPWINSTATTYSVSLHNLAFRGGSTSAIIGGTGNYYCLSMRDIFASNLKSALGTQTQALTITAANFTGDWEINNSYNSAIHIQGSDSTLWPDGMLLDSGTAFNSTPGMYHLWCDSMDKSYIGPLYITCEGPWGGVKVDGTGFNSTSTNMAALVFHGLKIEGRNPGAPCYGANVRINGGRVVIRDSWISYGMSATATFGQGDQGLIHHAGGALVLDGNTYDRATSVAETTPWVYTTSNDDAIVRSTMRASRGGTWTGRPRFALASGNTDNRISDGTTTLVSV